MSHGPRLRRLTREDLEVHYARILRWLWDFSEGTERSFRAATEARRCNASKMAIKTRPGVSKKIRGQGWKTNHIVLTKEV